METKNVKSKKGINPKKSWAEKIKKEQKDQLTKIDKPFAGFPANSSMYIATPYIIDQYIQSIPKGKSIEVLTIRKDLAAENHVDFTCPLTTGIFLRIVAEAAYEQYEKGVALKNITPFWRVIEPDSPLAKKLSFGQQFLIEQRQKENLSTIKLNPSKKKAKAL